MNFSRREVLCGAVGAVGAVGANVVIGRARSPANAGAETRPSLEQIVATTRYFIWNCALPDGGFAPSPDRSYKGNSDTSLSDLAAVTYAAVLAKTMGWEMPDSGKSVAFIHRHQQTDGRFINLAGKMDPKDPLALLYNMTQGVVGLRAMGKRPEIDPTPVMTRFFENETYRKLPWYATSFFPLFFAAIDKPFPESWSRALAEHMIANQADDGYIQDHVAATFHMAHFFRLIGKPTPKASAMVKRTIHDQKPDGGWDIKDPDWDVHACFDALFILRQLGGADVRCREAIARGGQWALRCRNPDGGFGHYPGRHSDMDAVYFNFGSLIQAGTVKMKTDLSDPRTLAWGHAMQPTFSGRLAQ